MTSGDANVELAAAAARMVIEEGLDYAAAKRKALRALGPSRARPGLPSNEMVEDQVREQLTLFHADTQPGELRALRHVALRWLERLAEFRPHLAGAVWRGTATRLSAIHLDLYADDPKAPEIALLNLGRRFDSLDAGAGHPGQAQAVLALTERCEDWPEPVTVVLTVHDHDDLRGALLPDAAGRSWRGDAQSLRRLIAMEAS
jgi:hypothetical protein